MCIRDMSEKALTPSIHLKVNLTKGGKYGIITGGKHCATSFR